MIVIRIIGAATALVLAFMVLTWVFTGERKWLRRAWLVFRVALVVVVVFLLLLFGEALFSG
ncbi:MAG: hypothetical protein ACT4P4_25015 [Betaproteobacteria bacterium]